VTDTLPIDSIIVGNRHRRDLGDVNELARSIETVGLLHPVVVTRDNRLVAGERRILACETLGWTEVPVRFVDLDAIVLGEHAENEVRKDFTTSERVDIGKEVEAELGRRQGQRTDLKASAEPVLFAEPVRNRAQVEPGQKTRDIAAQKAGFSSKDQYERAKTVVDRGVPELVDKMDHGKVSISGAALIAKQPQDEQQRILAEDNLKRAVSNLREAEEQASEASKLPPADPIPDDLKARQEFAFGSRDDRAIAAILDEVIERVESQPEPAEAVRRIPPAIAHGVNTGELRAAARWLLTFCDLWEKERAGDVPQAAE
jgi:ParB-like chromosome segregation protein Spo0J